MNTRVKVLISWGIFEADGCQMLAKRQINRDVMRVRALTSRSGCFCAPLTRGKVAVRNENKGRLMWRPQTILHLATVETNVKTSQTNILTLTCGAWRNVFRVLDQSTPDGTVSGGPCLTSGVFFPLCRRVCFEHHRKTFIDVSLLFLARVLQDLSPPPTHSHHLTTPVIPWWDPTDR